ncbi:MAG TPA: M1 family peptidase, partial [Gammaproteobacteria bacterium]|nr:M1 family peptidase [Gammaproteobacteria bacterium]
MHTLRQIFLFGFLWCLWLISAAPSPAMASADVIHHNLKVKLAPNTGIIEVEDVIRFAASKPPAKTQDFTLYPALKILRTTPSIPVKTLSPGHYQVSLPPGENQFTLHYKGKIQHHFSDISDSPGHRQPYTQGWIGPEGIFLDGSAPWYPDFHGQRLTFDLQVELPDGWITISQGQHPNSKARNTWQEHQPQVDIYLVAGPFIRYQKNTPNGLAEVYLRAENPALVQRYLQATGHYLKAFSDLLGPYPYPKFALVENFWNSGYGMPSFTLLGPQIIPLPFILHTSYPHEILHNWFGNGVYVNYTQGNWSEGLTSYLADHGLKESSGKDRAYRRQSLQRYADYVARDNDFPLQQFRARHGESSQAIGYSKSLMIFHMLRRELGDALFFRGLRQFYQQHKFTRAGFSDLQAAWEKVSGKNLAPFFNQWLTRTGAPQLTIRDVKITTTANTSQITATLAQTQKEAAFTLRVPISIQLADQKIIKKALLMEKKSQTFHFSLPNAPVKLSVDPEFDLFRHLDPAELPPSFSQFFGSQKATLILPSEAPEAFHAAYEKLARSWQQKRSNWQIIDDNQLKNLPTGQALLILGAENRFRQTLLDQTPSITASEKTLTVHKPPLDPREKSIALALSARDHPIAMLLSAHDVSAISGLSRKLPHYGKYGYLAFEGTAPNNTLKGQWQTQHSPLTICFSGTQVVDCQSPG